MLALQLFDSPLITQQTSPVGTSELLYGCHYKDHQAYRFIRHRL